MKNILTTEEKQYLNRISRYLEALGMNQGILSIELDYDQSHIEEKTINWNQIEVFDNNYRAEILPNLKLILKKVWNYVVNQNLYDIPDVDLVNYNNIEIIINAKSKDLTIKHYWTFYDQGSTEDSLFDSDEDKKMFDDWMENELKDTEVPEDGILTLKYNGSGDSGYIEGSFDETGDVVPNSIEDWCYRELEKQYGGWEINEGSEGVFVFDFKTSTIELQHTANIEEQDSKTLFEENYSL